MTSSCDVFLGVLAASGCTLCPQGVAVSNGDTLQLQRKLELRLTHDAPLLHNFTSGLQDYVAHDDNFRRLFVSLTSAAEMKHGFFGSDSLARVLLSLTSLQTQVANILLEKLPEYVADASSLHPSSIKDNMPRLILSQFRWLDSLVESENVTKKLMEISTICPLDLKKEIISLLPEIVTDENYDMVIMALEQMLQEDSQLTVPILDAFSNFNLEGILLDKVVSLALSSLRSADSEDLPLVVRFLLQSVNTENIRRIIHQLRENIQFAPISNVQRSLSDKKMKGKSVSINCESFVLEALRSGSSLQNVICEAFFKEMKLLDEEQDHKVVDIWWLLIIYANGGVHRKAAESLVKKKVIAGHFGIALLRHSICGRGLLLQDYFQALVSLAGFLLASKESAAREFGLQAYVLLFEEFVDAYFRQEVLGSLVTHTGSGVAHEVGSALESLVLLSTKYPKELLAFSSFINGILDYMDGFQDYHLHQVYRVFSQLTIASWCSGATRTVSSIANELLIVIRKQISSLDPKYKRMGIIGAVGLASCLVGDKNASVLPFPDAGQKACIQEALALLEMVLEMCKGSSVAKAFFYDELSNLLERVTLHSSIVEWISKQTNEFETVFLVDLDGGRVRSGFLDSGTIEGEIWMNLDGNVSPVLLNILTLLTSNEIRSSKSLIFLPSSFRLLVSMECMTNQGSLGGIDALLGCPLYLPNYKLFVGEKWTVLPSFQRETLCLALFYSINWIRELINAFSTQIEGRIDGLTQTTREEISAKILKRLRNLIFLEHVLNECMKFTPVSFPCLHSLYDLKEDSSAVKSSCSKIPAIPKRGRKRKTLAGQDNRNEGQAVHGRTIQSTEEDNFGSGQQTVDDAFRDKATNEGANCSQQFEDGTAEMHQNTIGSLNKDSRSSEGENVAEEISSRKEINEPVQLLEAQRWRFRPLSVSCIVILSISKSQVANSQCCHDPAAQMPLFLYVLRDLQYKLECLQHYADKQMPLAISNAVKAPSGLGLLTASEYFKRLEPLFPCLRHQLDYAAGVLISGSSRVDDDERMCSGHWISESLAAGNPEILDSLSSQILVAKSLFIVILRCLNQIFTNTEFIVRGNLPSLKTALLAFGSSDCERDFCSDLHLPPSLGTMEYAFCSTYACLDKLVDAATESLSVAVELVKTLRGLILCAQNFVETATERTKHQSTSTTMTEFVPYLRSRLSTSVGRILKHKWKDGENGKNLRNKGDILQQLLQMFIQYSKSPIELLEELACNIMPQVSVRKGNDASFVPEYPTLCPSTFITWYRVQHEEVLSIFNRVVKDSMALHKSHATKVADVELVLVRTHQCAMIMVSLVNLSKLHDKTPVHALAVKFGGKFIDTFLKGMEFFHSQYEAHRDSINALVKELQKATRTIQMLCSEAKGMKRMPVTCKIPAVKRSMERYVFHIKALLHSAAQGSSFWMGNLKHKNLQGEEVGSQLPLSEEDAGRSDEGEEES